tara:strand:+ start:821 stop:1084 length:264 start_codon:yes stop_codon:yes gene_type:complete
MSIYSSLYLTVPASILTLLWRRKGKKEFIITLSATGSIHCLAPVAVIITFLAYGRNELLSALLSLIYCIVVFFTLGFIGVLWSKNRN